MPESIEATSTTTNKADTTNSGNVGGNDPLPDMDGFGLPVKKHKTSIAVVLEEGNVASREDSSLADSKEPEGLDSDEEKEKLGQRRKVIGLSSKPTSVAADGVNASSDDEEFKDAQSSPPLPSTTPVPESQERILEKTKPIIDSKSDPRISPERTLDEAQSDNKERQDDLKLKHFQSEAGKAESTDGTKAAVNEDAKGGLNSVETLPSRDELPKLDTQEGSKRNSQVNVTTHPRAKPSLGLGISEWSHQQMAPKDKEEEELEEEDEWQTMPAFAPYDMYDDDNRLIAKEATEDAVEQDAYAGLGGAGRGYTRVQLDEDAQSATSLDENTQYLFKDVNGTGAGEEEDEEQRDAVSQMQATKDLLTEGQRIAYIGMTRLILSGMVRNAESMVISKGSKKETQLAAEGTKMWSQKMMVRLYSHMDINSAEQIMIEQLAEHGVQPADLTPTLMQNARVKNPMAENSPSTTGFSSPRPESIASQSIASSRPSVSSRASIRSPKLPHPPRISDEETAEAPPPYIEHDGDDLPEVRTPSQLPNTAKIDIDLRWTVLCDLFLTLVADSIYDARSRVLLERVGENMGVSWIDICRFEKRVTDALEMQQAAEKENWNEDEHKENRRKMALRKRYMMMGLATVGGSLVIGLSAGLLAPMIGAGLAAGFTTIGVAGTSGFLAGAGGAAIITSGAAASGGVIAIRAADRRTGAVKTFEYRPLHNNKRVNLIVTVSGWMTGKVDDVRLPYSTVDPVMGDIYSVLWEPEMLTSMGDTINILATEALTQGLQQVLGSTILIGLMAALQLPVVLTKLAYLIDNPWTVSLDRANAAGLILADSLIDRNLGTRPITFVGYSLGSRVIFSCLKELSRRGAYGLVQNVYLFGSPIVAKKDEYLKARSVVAGRFVNGYAKNDWILGYLFRLTSGGISRVAGLGPIEEVPDLENVDVTELVPGHMAYRTAMPKLLRKVGWMVESDEFTEIEDPDPENHAQRQRELINEIEEARKEFEKKEKEAQSKGKFGWLSRKKKTVVERKEWETYEDAKSDPNSAYSATSTGSRIDNYQDSNQGVLFDIDAIRAELASEQMEVKELKSTLPPMKLDLGSPSSITSNPRATSSPRGSLKETKLYDTNTTLKPNSVKPPATTFSPRQASSEYIPQFRPPPSYGEGEEEHLEMTFDTAYHSPPLSATPSFSSLPPLPPKSTTSTPYQPSYQSPMAEPRERAATLQGPHLNSSKTMPAPLPVIDQAHNAWADEDEDFGKEKEIEMTFA